MIEEFTVGSDVERAEQHIGEVEGPEIAVELSHVAQDKLGLDAAALGLLPAKFDHCRAQIESAIGVAPPVPFLQIRRGAGAELEDSFNFGFREPVDCGFEKID